MGRLLFFALVAVSMFAQTPAQKPPAQTPAEDQAPAPPPLKTTVTVNGTISSEAPAAITVLGRQQLQAIPGINLDDRLRQVPGFSLFRRSSSLVANPTTQGVSLRATGSSGASRTLVLWDSIPLNDPFGGWVYWTRIDPAFVDRVEIERGGTTAAFGDRAFGGSISLFTPAPEENHLFVNALAGSQGTVDLSSAYSNTWGKWGLTAHSRAFDTDGYYIVPAELRGTADDKASVRFATGDVHVDYLGNSNRLSFRVDVLAEERRNGTQLTRNSTGLGTVGLNYNHTWKNDQVSVLLFHTRERYNSTFSSVSADRNTERLASDQHVPAESYAGAAYWQHFGSVKKKRWTTLVGSDVNDVHGTSFDYSYTTRVTTPGGGTLLQRSVFAQGDLDLGRVHFYSGIRYQYTGIRDVTFVSPNAGMSVGLGNFRFRASGYRTLRAPTLNELYRNFRVGNALTLANSALRPEGLTGVETGVDWSTPSSRISLTLFRNDLSALITNTTLSIAPTLILRQRTNLSDGISQGIEASALHRWKHWWAEAAYLYADAHLNTGYRISQVPKQQGTAQLSFRARNTTISGGIRALGLQFDDDINQFKLPGFAALQLTAQQRLTPDLSLVAAFDNLLDRSYLVALTPTPNTGTPRQWRIGLRWSGAIR